MNENNLEEIDAQKTIPLHARGKIYFSRKRERELFFVLTIIMLGLGILAKLGLF